MQHRAALLQFRTRTVFGVTTVCAMLFACFRFAGWTGALAMAASIALGLMGAWSQHRTYVAAQHEVAGPENATGHREPARLAVPSRLPDTASVNTGFAHDE